MVVFVIALSGQPLATTVLLCLIQTLQLFYLLRYRPFKDRFELIVSVIAEFLLLCAFIIALTVKIISSSNPSVEERNQIGWALISINLAVSIVTAVIIAKQLLTLLIMLARKLRARIRSKNNTNQITPAENIEGRVSYQNQFSEVAFMGSSPDHTLSRNDLAVAIDQIDSAQSLLKSNLNRSMKSLNEVKLNFPERNKVESLLKSTLKLFNSSSAQSQVLMTPKTPKEQNLSQNTSLVFMKINSDPNKDMSPIKEVPSRELDSNPGTIFLDHHNSNDKHNSNLSSERDSGEESSNMSINQNMKENIFGRGKQVIDTYKRYFFRIPNAKKTAESNTWSVSEFVKPVPVEMTRENKNSETEEIKISGAAEDNQNDEDDQMTLGRSSIESNKVRKPSSMLLLNKKKEVHAAFERRIQTRLATMNILNDMSGPTSKVALDNTQD